MIHPLRRWRFEREMTLTKLAKDRRLRTTQSYLTGIETGQKTPSVDMIRKLVAITGIPAGDFVNFKVSK